MPVAIQDTTQQLGFMENTIGFLEFVVIHATPSAPFGLKHLAKKGDVKRAHLHIAHNSIN